MIGVLALQGAIKEHVDVLHHCGAKTKLVKKVKDLDDCIGLIIPGGESTTMKILGKDIFEALQTKFSELPVFGTCAGAIILADISKIDVVISRNAYGSHTGSFIESLEFGGNNFDGIFIRAPVITSVDDKLEVLVERIDENGLKQPVCVKSDKVMICTFHPELTSFKGIHNMFISML